MRQLMLLFLLVIFSTPSSELYAQMEIGGTVYYGNEWIDYDKTYYKIPVAEDGLYKLSTLEIEQAGLSLSGINGSELAIIHEGKAIPLYISNEGTLGTDDFILFIAERNKTFLDQFLYEGGADWMLNKNYSLYNDTSIYYLVVDKDWALRYDNYENIIDEDLVAKSWHHYEDVLEFHENYHKDYRKAAGISYLESHFVKNEGWASENVRTHNLDFHPMDLVQDSMQAQVKVRFISDYNEHDLSITLNNIEVYREDLNRFELKELSFDVANNEIRKNRVRLRLRGEIDGHDRYTVVKATLTYPRETSSLDGINFCDKLTDNRYYEIGGIIGSGNGWVHSGSYFFPTVVDGEKHVVNASNINIGEELQVFGSQGIREAKISSTKTFESYDDLKETNLIFLTSEKIVENVPSLQEYKQYRESVEGGSFQTEIITVEDLYDQFGYGVERHPMAVKNFLYYLDKEGTDLEFVFIVGKGIEHVDARTAEDFESPLIQDFRVPTFGYPSSDDLLCSPTDKIAPLYAVGRLAFNTETEIALYLDKVKVNEANYNNPNVDESIWKKRLLHLNAGGAGEFQVIDGHFRAMTDISHSSILNPNISTFKKTSNAPIQFTEIESIFKEINKGVKYVTFYGHSSSVSLAFDLARKESYENYDQMPLLIALGCSAGNLNIPGKSLGEVYGGYKTGGYLGIWSSTHYAFISSLSTIGKNFYEIALNNTEGYRVGEVIKKTIENSSSSRRVCEQMMFFGDPALKFSLPQGPDPALDIRSISHKPERPTPASDSLYIEFELTNLGAISTDSVRLDYVHTLPGEEIRTVYVSKISIPDYKDTIKLAMAIDSSMAGFNYFDVRINHDKEVKEWPGNSAYENNSFTSIGLDKGYEVYIQSGTVTAVYPSDYAIVPMTRPEIVLSGSPYVGDSMDVEVELDTTRLFNSPAKISERFAIAKGTERWRVPNELEEDVVYYWRVKVANDENSKWESRSFVYLDGKTGWNQSHYYQFLDNEYDGVDLNDKRLFVVDSTIQSWHIDNAVMENNEGIVIYRNGEKLNQGTFWIPRFTGAYITLIDETSGLLAELNPPGGAYGAINNKSTSSRTFAYDLTIDTSRINMLNFIENVIKENRYVMLSFNKYDLMDSFNISEWRADSIINNGRNIYNVLEAMGARDIRQMEQKGDVPYVFMFQKGGRVFAEEIGQYQTDVIGATADFPIPNDLGIITSPLIINFKEFEQFEYETSISDSAATHKLFMHTFPDSIPVLSDSTQNNYNRINIDSVEVRKNEHYRLSWEIGNSQFRKLPQSKFWRVIGSTYGDYLLTAGDKLNSRVDYIENFDSLMVDFYIHNISHDNLDTGLVEIILKDENNRELYAERYSLSENIVAFDSLYQVVTIPIESSGKILTLHVNLIIPEDMPELTKLNNTLIKKYRLLHDRLGPFISVYFDGERINNGDIVAHNSQIKVAIEDKTDILPLANTDGIHFSILDPDRNDMEYDFSSPSVEFIPAIDHTAYVIIDGDFKEEGLYTFKVNATDRSGNEAGEVDYIIQFRIENEYGVSNFINYPNPFRDATKFRYELTSKNNPPSYEIIIVNGTGEIVTILNEQTLGDLRIGAHSTQAWDGRGRDGQLLPTGVYFYKMKLDTDKQYGHIERPYDHLFKKYWGKMLIVR